MFVHNFATWLKKVMAARRLAGETVVRMNVNQRVQHGILLLSFFVLAVTGFALKFPDSWLAWVLGSDEIIRRNLHRVAGVVMMVLGVYHILYLAFAQDGRQLFKDLWPTRKDFADFAGNLKFLAGVSSRKPEIGRFGYVEKAEYWAMVWGTIIMGVTGFMLWFQVEVTHYLQRWVVEVATTIHYYEAILACLAIIVWHLYHVIFDPSVYPGNWAFWNGRMCARLHEEEHPLDKEAHQRKG
jgi:formate dehydrogenase gamma subunit